MKTHVFLEGFGGQESDKNVILLLKGKYLLNWSL